jgi:hypothetical protein
VRFVYFQRMGAGKHWLRLFTAPSTTPAVDAALLLSEEQAGELHARIKAWTAAPAPH